ncbi:MAG: hypothetical protein ACOX17_00495 [Christensenellales bacterium]|jgi:hypothetical protein
MKKLSIVFTVLLLVFLLGACSLLPAGLLPFKNIPSPTEDPVASPVETLSAEESEEPGSDPPGFGAPGFEDPVIAVPEYGEITFEGLVVADNDECAIKITAFEPHNTWGGYILTLHLENKSREKTYLFNNEYGTINDMECNLLLYTEVAPGKTAEDIIIISEDQLHQLGITACTDIELTLTAYDIDGDWVDPVTRVTVHVYPYGEERATVFVRENRPEDTVLFDDEYVTVIVIGYEPETYWGFAVELYLVNKTDKDLSFTVSNASVNGYMADPLWSRTVRSGKKAFASMFWTEEILEGLDITEVEEIEMRFSVFDSHDWEAENLIEEVVVLTP